MALLANYDVLIHAISQMNEVVAMGKSGGKELPEQNESDIDIFVFCNQVPDLQTREAVIGGSGISALDSKLGETGGSFWGVCDYIVFKEAEICLMYFSVQDMNDDIESVLSGLRLDREGEYFYPTGRCASFLTMHILYDKANYISTMKERLSTYPRSLAEKLLNHHIGKIHDAEDFERAVSRGDILFYHSTLESALDHFLQALFALNRCFFPSRKRTIQFVECFQCKPDNCAERLLKTIELGSRAETLSQSYRGWSALCDDLLEIARVRQK